MFPEDDPRITGADDPAGPRTSTGRRRSVNIHDVARAAGVSYQTVSRVINGHPSVRPTTREEVLRSISELGFRPNLAARSLASGQTRTVTVLTSNTTLYGFAATLRGIEEAARREGFAVGVRVIESAAPSVVRATVEQLGHPTSGALIVLAFDLAGVRVADALPDGLAVATAVEAPSGPARHRFPSVWLDDAVAAELVTRYLLGLGHRTVHYVAIPSSTRSSARLRGWRRALEEAAVPVPQPLTAEWTPISGYRAGQSLAQDGEVTAVLCGNDDLAVGVLRALHDAGRGVPGDVSVAGFDDDPHSAFYNPSLTTVRLDFVGLGQDCFHLLLRAVDPAAPARPPISRPPELVVRESTGRRP